MIHEFEFRHTSEMVEGMTSKYMLGGDSIVTDFHFYRAYTKPIIIRVAEPTPDLNFRYVAQPKTRWIKFCRDYLDPSFLDWYQRCFQISHSAELGYSFHTKSNHKLGNCAVHLSFRVAPEPTITLMNRASYIIPTASLELSLVNIVAERLSQHYKTRVRLLWMSAQMQFSAIYGLPYIMSYWLPRHQVEFDQFIQSTPESQLTPMVKKFLVYLDRLNSGEGKAINYQRVARAYKKTEGAINAEYDDYIPMTIFIDGVEI